LELCKFILTPSHWEVSRANYLKVGVVKGLVTLQQLVVDKHYQAEILGVVVFFENLWVFFVNLPKFWGPSFDCVLVNLKFLWYIQERGTWRDVFRRCHAYQLAFCAERSWEFDSRMEDSILVAPVLKSNVFGHLAELL
jgi:hypothetical protein